MQENSQKENRGKFSFNPRSFSDFSILTSKFKNLQSTPLKFQKLALEWTEFFFLKKKPKSSFVISYFSSQFDGKN
jgi:hypothetical protein